MKTKETLTLECILSDKEKLAYAKEMSEAISECTRKEESLKSFQTLAKAEITSLEAKRNMLAEKLNKGKEYRSVECVILYDWEQKKKTWVRKDNGEIAKDDIIPEEELQQQLKLETPVDVKSPLEN